MAYWLSLLLRSPDGVVGAFCIRRGVLPTSRRRPEFPQMRESTLGNFVMYNLNTHLEFYIFHDQDYSDHYYKSRLFHILYDNRNQCRNLPSLYWHNLTNHPCNLLDRTNHFPDPPFLGFRPAPLHIRISF